jgi:hypothetical protein
MALNLSRSVTTGDKTVSQSNDFVIHGLRRDSTGMLYYTRVGSASSEVADFHRTDGTQYPGFLDGVDYVDETTEEKSYVNTTTDKYQQYRFDFRGLNYFIDDDGYLVARINGTYDYNTQGPK